MRFSVEIYNRLIVDISYCFNLFKSFINWWHKCHSPFRDSCRTLVMADIAPFSVPERSWTLFQCRTWQMTKMWQDSMCVSSKSLCSRTGSFWSWNVESIGEGLCLNLVLGSDHYQRFWGADFGSSISLDMCIFCWGSNFKCLHLSPCLDRPNGCIFGEPLFHLTLGLNCVFVCLVGYGSLSLEGTFLLEGSISLHLWLGLILTWRFQHLYPWKLYVLFFLRCYCLDSIIYATGTIHLLSFS